MRWVCLFLGTNKIEKRFRRCQAHPHFVVNSKRLARFLLLISARAENPYSQSNEDANGTIILMALAMITE